MEFWQEIWAQLLAGEHAQVTFPNLKLDCSTLVEGACYQALKKIKDILEDDRLEDSECFQKIEKIVSTLEMLGSGAGSRHDF